MSVVSIRKKNLKALGYRDLNHWLENDDHIYIGRLNRFVDGTFQSKWHNPFSVKKYGRKGCIDKYKEYIKNNKELFSDLEELNGKVLGCWCAPKACHGDVLLELLNSN